MKEIKTYLIVELKTKRPLYGLGQKSLVFSSAENAHEVASQLFEKKEDFLIIEIPDFKR